MKINILFGTETGNSEALAIQTEQRLTAEGFDAKVFSMDAIKAAELADSVTLIITSTWADGEAPSNAQELYEEVADANIDLSSVKYAVLGIGQSMFDNFCKCAKDFDEFFEKSNATRIQEIVLCDDDFDDKLPSWLDSIVSTLGAGV